MSWARTLLGATLAVAACGGGGHKPPGNSDAGPSPTKELGLTVGDTRARACDVRLTEGTRQVLGVAFESTVKGQWSRWEPRVGLAFTALADKPLGNVGKLTLRILKEEAQFPSTDVTCYDRAGARLSGVTVTIR